jgi:6,7-dimethyl-8-ribityllumazine synthase
MPHVVEGHLTIAPGLRFALVAARFNHFIVDHLVEGALDALRRHGGDADNALLVRVPGAWEVPLACKQIAKRGDIDAIVSLAAVIRGSTPHFDYVASEVSKGVAQVSLDFSLPITFGVLTTESIEQAVERAGTKAGNKGFDAMLSAIEMVSLHTALHAYKPATRESAKSTRDRAKAR